MTTEIQKLSAPNIKFVPDENRMAKTKIEVYLTAHTLVVPGSQTGQEFLNEIILNEADMNARKASLLKGGHRIFKAELDAEEITQ